MNSVTWDCHKNFLIYHDYNAIVGAYHSMTYPRFKLTVPSRSPQIPSLFLKDGWRQLSSSSPFHKLNTHRRRGGSEGEGRRRRFPLCRCVLPAFPRIPRLQLGQGELCLFMICSLLPLRRRRRRKGGCCLLFPTPLHKIIVGSN